MDPIELQQAQLNLAKSGMPIITDKTTRPVKIDRKTGKRIHLATSSRFRRLFDDSTDDPNLSCANAKPWTASGSPA